MTLKLKPREFKLGDVIKAYDGAFGTACVTKITKESVQLHRPYGLTDDFESTAGVNYYTGVEIYSLWLTSEREYELYSSKEVR
jgi:hypothetical protein